MRKQDTIGAPSKTILCDSLLHDIYGALICSWGRSLQSCFGEIKRMTYQSIQRFSLDPRPDNILPTKTAETPPNPPEMKDLADSVAET